MMQAELRQYAHANGPEPKGSSHLTVRKHRQQLNKSKLLGNIALFIFAFSVVATFVYVQSSLLGYKLVSLKQDVNKLEISNKRLEYSIAQLSSLDRVENVAHTKLKMVKPEAGNMIAVVGQPHNQVALSGNQGVKDPSQKVSLLRTFYLHLSQMVDNTRFIGMNE